MWTKLSKDSLLPQHTQCASNVFSISALQDETSYKYSSWNSIFIRLLMPTGTWNHKNKLKSKNWMSSLKLPEPMFVDCFCVFVACFFFYVYWIEIIQLKHSISHVDGSRSQHQVPCSNVQLVQNILELISILLNVNDVVWPAIRLLNHLKDQAVVVVGKWLATLLSSGRSKWKL